MTIKKLTFDFVNQNRFESMREPNLSKAKDDTERAHIQCTYDGGRCACGAEYQRKEVKNRFAAFACWEPTCKCFEVYEGKQAADMTADKRYIKAQIPEAFAGYTLKALNREITEDLGKAYKKIITYLKEREYLRHGLILLGDAGTGKTHCAVAVLKEAMRATDKPGLFVSCAGLVERMMRDKDFMMDALEAEYILLDDIDKVFIKGVESYGYEQVFRLIDALTARGKRLFITTNASLEDLAEKFTPPVFGRIVKDNLQVVFKGADYRCKQLDLEINF